MSQNLALLPPNEKQKIELDKQAAYAVWQVKNALADKSILSEQSRAITDDNERSYFVDAINKYSVMMGL